MTTVEKPRAEMTIEEILGAGLCVIEEQRTWGQASPGDSKHIWDRTKPDEVSIAKDIFKKLKDKGFAIFKVKGSEGSKDGLMHDFDPSAERMIATGPMVGG